VGSFKNLLQNLRANFNRLDTNHPWVKGIHVCSKKGDCPSPRGNNCKRVRKCTGFLKKSSPEPAGQIQSNLVQIILG
jgi:hypothetical protein